MGCNFSNRGGQNLLILRYQEWFSRAVQEWLSLSKAKLEARIHLAINQDKVWTRVYTVRVVRCPYSSHKPSHSILALLQLTHAASLHRQRKSRSY